MGYSAKSESCPFYLETQSIRSVKQEYTIVPKGQSKSWKEKLFVSEVRFLDTLFPPVVALLYLDLY